MNKASGSDGIPTELLQILRDDAVKVLHSVCQQIWKTQQWPQNWKRSVFISIPKKGNATECSNYCTIALISQSNAQNSPSKTSTVHELRISRCSSWILKKQRNQSSNCQHPLYHRKSKRVPERHPLLLYWLCQSCWLWITINWKIFQEMGIPDHLTCPLRNLYAGQEARVRTGYGTMDWFQIGKGVYVKTIYCYPVYLTYMLSTSCKMLG